MNEFLDFSTIFFLILAVIIFVRLRSVLGRRTGSERPPFDPYSRTPEPGSHGSSDNVVALPSKTGVDESAAEEHESDDRLKKVAPEGTALNTALKAILSADRSFDPDHFLQGARAAYEMIVTAFADGDRKILKNLLSGDVYEGFEQAIKSRDERKESVDFTFVGIDAAELVEAALKDGAAMVTVRFRSQLISATRNKDGAVIEGDPNRVSEVTDIWTFSREVASREPNWKLIATEADQ